MAEDTSNLAAYLEGERANGSQCWCESAPPKIVAQVNAAVVEGGSKQWTAITRWLHTQDIKITKGKLEYHFTKGHAENYKP